MKSSTKSSRVPATWSLHLSRKIAEKRLPGHRHHPLRHPQGRAADRAGRAAEDVDTAQDHPPHGEIDSIEFLIDKLSATKTNDEFFDSMKRQQK